jgi:5'-3' exonuclease
MAQTNLFAGDAVVLVDGKNFLFRNFYPHAKLKTQAGEPTGALYGCLNGLLSLAHRLPNSPIAFVWEGGGETWRHRLLKPRGVDTPPDTVLEKKIKEIGWFDKQVKKSVSLIQSGVVAQAPLNRPVTIGPTKVEGYKATRRINSSEEQLGLRRMALRQVPELRKIFRLLGVPQFEVAGLECDDLIGILTEAILREELFQEVIVNSTDKDFYQLLTKKGVRIMQQDRFVSASDVMAEFGVGVEDWVKYRAIIGDESDNIPNIFPGIGPVKGRKLLKLGVDASKKNYQDVNETALMELMQFSKDGMEIPEVWKKLRTNYLASHIVVDDKFYLFDYNVRRDAGEIVTGLKRRSFFRNVACKTEEAHREFCEWLVRKEMDTLRERQDEFFYLL